MNMLKGICGVIIAAGLCQAMTANASLTSAAEQNWSLSKITIPGVENGALASALPKAEVITENLGVSVQSSFGSGSFGSVATPMSVVPEPGTAMLGALLLIPLAAAWRKARA